jgi:SAM-dependent methyltransferase
MNARHSKVTDWALSRVAIKQHFAILDVGCGGGRTVGKLAALATEGKVFGLDVSRDSVIVASNANREWIRIGRVEIREGTVSQLPFAADTFDFVIAVETHFWWPDLPTDMREVLRVLKPGGALVIVAEVYRGADTAAAKLAERYVSKTGMRLLSADEHRNLFVGAGYTDIEVVTEPRRGWIFAMGRKQQTAQS